MEKSTEVKLEDIIGGMELQFDEISTYLNLKIRYIYWTLKEHGMFFGMKSTNRLQLIGATIMT